MSKVLDAWRRIAQWHRENLPGALRDEMRASVFLREGASATEISAAEKAMGLNLPPDVRESYRLHDGSLDGYAILPWGFQLLPLASVVESWRMWQSHVAVGLFERSTSKPEGAIKPLHWNTRWVPVSHNGGGDHHCVDLDPAFGGKIGQIIEFNHEVGPIVVLASGLGAWLSNYASELAEGRYRYDPDDLWVVPVGSE